MASLSFHYEFAHNIYADPNILVLDDIAISDSMRLNRHIVASQIDYPTASLLQPSYLNAMIKNGGTADQACPIAVHFILAIKPPTPQLGHTNGATFLLTAILSPLSHLPPANVEPSHADKHNFKPVGSSCFVAVVVELGKETKYTDINGYGKAGVSVDHSDAFIVQRNIDIGLSLRAPPGSMISQITSVTLSGLAQGIASSLITRRPSRLGAGLPSRTASDHP
jgi:hypothetical protein